jgi:hypothetical protein
VDKKKSKSACSICQEVTAIMQAKDREIAALESMLKGCETLMDKQFELLEMQRAFIDELTARN